MSKDTGLDIKDHNEFTPVIGLTYTPRQYYWMDGYRKEYLHSHYPTFRIELARSIPDLLGCTGNLLADGGRHEPDRTAGPYPND